MNINNRNRRNRHHSKDLQVHQYKEFYLKRAPTVIMELTSI
jgi:hypothetical protein